MTLRRYTSFLVFFLLLIVSLCSATTKKECKKPTPKPPTTTPTSSTNNSNSSSSANAGASSNSSSSATGGNATATGGSANQQQGQQQQQTQNNNQNQSVNASNGGQQNSQSTNYSTSYQQVRQAPMAYAPDAAPSAPCRVAGSAGVSAPIGGVSFGGSKMDDECDLRESARAFALLSNRIAAAKILCQTKAAKKAHLTEADCLTLEAPEQPAPQPAPVSIILPNSPAAPPVAAVTPADYNQTIDVTTPAKQLVGICTFAKANTCQVGNGPAVITVSTICKQMLAAAQQRLKSDPNSILFIVGNRNPSESEITAASRANNVKKYLIASGIKESRINVSTGNGTSRTVELYSDAR